MNNSLACSAPGEGPTTNAACWETLAEEVLAGQTISRSDAQQIINCDDDDVLALLHAAYRIRQHYFGKQVQLYYLMNAKSGLCPEDCSYCSQAKNSTAEIPKYNLLRRDVLLDGAKQAYEQGAKTYCMVISARDPSERELSAIESIVPEIKSRFPLHICVSLGLLDGTAAKRLKACGVDRVNHNLNTSEAHYPSICTTHTFQDRVDTLRAVRNAGIEICSGGIVGMGEEPADLVEMAFSLRDLNAESIPINFLIPIEGAALGQPTELKPLYCLKVLAMVRFVCPKSEIRIAGGRELHLRSLQPLGLYAANSVFVGDYLTTQGQPPEEDYSLIRDLGMEPVVASHEAGLSSAGDRD